MIEKFRFSRSMAVSALFGMATAFGWSAAAHAEEQSAETERRLEVPEKDALGDAQFAPGLGFWRQGSEPERPSATVWRTPAIPEAFKAHANTRSAKRNSRTTLATQAPRSREKDTTSEPDEPQVQLEGGYLHVQMELGMEALSWNRVNFAGAPPMQLRPSEKTAFVYRTVFGTRFGTLGKTVQPWAQGLLGISSGGTMGMIGTVRGFTSRDEELTMLALDLEMRGGVDVFPWPYLGGGPLLGYHHSSYHFTVLNHEDVGLDDLFVKGTNSGHTLGFHVRYQAIKDAGSVPTFFVDLFVESRKGDFISATYGRADVGFGVTDRGELGLLVETCLGASELRQVNASDVASALDALSTSFPLDSRLTLQGKVIF